MNKARATKPAKAISAMITRKCDYFPFSDSIAGANAVYLNTNSDHDPSRTRKCVMKVALEIAKPKT